MMPTTSRVPAVMDALVAAFTDALPDVAVYDGPTPGSTTDLPAALLVVGAPDTEGVCVTSTNSRAAGMGTRRQEVFFISCIVEAVTGAGTFAALRETVRGTLASVETVLTADVTLGQVCDEIGIGPDLRWAQVAAEDGVGVGVSFTVQGRALL